MIALCEQFFEGSLFEGSLFEGSLFDESVGLWGSHCVDLSAHGLYCVVYHGVRADAFLRGYLQICPWRGNLSRYVGGMRHVVAVDEKWDNKPCGGQGMSVRVMGRWWIQWVALKAT
jgi:hypothetical protein